MSMSFFFFFFSLIPYKIWTTHLALNFHIFLFFFTFLHGNEEDVNDENDSNIDLNYGDEFG